MEKLRNEFQELSRTRAAYRVPQDPQGFYFRVVGRVCQTDDKARGPPGSRQWLKYWVGGIAWASCKSQFLPGLTPAHASNFRIAKLGTTARCGLFLRGEHSAYFVCLVVSLSSWSCIGRTTLTSSLNC